MCCIVWSTFTTCLNVIFSGTKNKVYENSMNNFECTCQQVLFYFFAVMPYKVLIFPSLKFGCSTTSANPWISLAGQLGETGMIEIPKGCLECNIEVRFFISGHFLMQSGSFR